MLAILAAVMLAAAPQHDTVFTADGGRVVGTVVEEGPQGVAVQLADGTVRRLPRRDVVRIEYSDGSVSTFRPSEPRPSPPARAAPAQPYPPPAYTPPPPPGYTPPPPPAYPPYAYPPRPPPAWQGGPVSPVYLSFGLGALGLGGHAESGIAMNRLFDPQLNLAFEGGVRLNPHIALALYADIGVGDPAREVRDFCNSNGFACDASTGRFGILLRHTFQPAARATPWIAAGTGYEYGSAYASDNGQEILRYSGWEMLRLMAGFDLRSSPVFGVGFYGGISFGRYSHYEEPTFSLNLSDRATHTTIEGGLRFTLFP